METPEPHYDLVRKPPEVPDDDPRADCRFDPESGKPFVATTAAVREHTRERIMVCLAELRRLAEEHDGLDYLQVFEPVPPAGRENLWIIEDGPGGAVTALLPGDY